MNLNKPSALLFTSMIYLLAACGTPNQNSPIGRVNLGQERVSYRFDTPQTPWDTFSLGGDQAVYQVRDDALIGAVVADRGYIWSLENNRYTDVSMGVTLQQTQGSRGNGFGVMCRADEDGNGYYFVISSAGEFAILKGTSTADDPIRLVDWQFSIAIRQGEETNIVQAICAGDYLSFSANGQFLGDVHDSTFSTGEIGVVLGAVEETLWVRFDDIVIRDAQLAR